MYLETPYCLESTCDRLISSLALLKTLRDFPLRCVDTRAPLRRLEPDPLFTAPGSQTQLPEANPTS